MKVSVLMSVYNEESRYISVAIESILSQTFTDFEFIVVGDSPESERERVFGLIEEYASKDNRIIFIPNDSNIGLTKSLNVGLQRCRGKYIARMDADDISVPTRLEKQVLFMDAHPDLLASSSWCQFIDENGDKLNTVVKTQDNPGRIRLDVLKNSVLCHPASIFRRVINGVPVIYDESVRYAQDYSLWVWLLQFGKLSNIQEVLLYYRITTAQISSAHKEDQYECARKAQRKAFEWLYGLPVVDSFMKVLSSITIEGRRDVQEFEAKEAFTSFFESTTITKINRAALVELTLLYAHYYHTPSKKSCVLISEITHRNPRLLIRSELEYFKLTLKRILFN